MRVNLLRCENFRSYEKYEVVLDKRVTVFVGPNAVGKTNLMEAIYLLARGESFRAGKIEEMIKWHKEKALVEGYVESGQGEERVLGVVLTRGELLGKKVPRRRFLIDRMGRQKRKFVRWLQVVIFRPEDLELIEGSPTRRRRFLDETLSMFDGEYGRAWQAYEKALRRRNKLLDLIREGEASREQLTFWDMSLIKNGNILTQKRQEMVDFFNNLEVDFGEYQVEYDASVISESRLRQYAREEVAAGYTLVGPHKDDLVFRSRLGEGWKDLQVYGSRGEQRLGVLFAKYGAMRFIEEKIGEKVVFLVDDIFSELDEKNRRLVMQMMVGRQVVMTTTEETEVANVEGKVITL